MTAKELKLDYFKFYDVANQSLDDWVTLQGQFDKEPERARILFINFFANAVSKNREALYNKYAHLNWYNIFDPVPEPTRVVVVENQFGKQKLLIGPARALLAPAQKYERGSQFPEALDHFKLYKVLEGEPVDKAVALKDQFGADEVKVTAPLAFAVPVKKEHAGTAIPIRNKRAHLVLYRITPRSMQRTELVRDQFGRRHIQIYRSVFLAAPSLKREWKEV